MDNQFNPNHKVFGRIGIVNRVRGGQFQMKKVISEKSGFRIQAGKLVRMTPQEIRNRKRAAKISARKRIAQLAAIIRHRMMSMLKRQRRLGV